jgi:hypothetical protein
MRAAVRRLWWGIEGQAVNICWPVGNWQFRGTARQGNFFLQFLDTVCRCRRLDAELCV